MITLFLVYFNLAFLVQASELSNLQNSILVSNSFLKTNLDYIGNISVACSMIPYNYRAEKNELQEIGQKIFYLASNLNTNSSQDIENLKKRFNEIKEHIYSDLDFLSPEIQAEITWKLSVNEARVKQFLQFNQKIKSLKFHHVNLINIDFFEHQARDIAQNFSFKSQSEIANSDPVSDLEISFKQDISFMEYCHTLPSFNAEIKVFYEITFSDNSVKLIALPLYLVMKT